MAERILTPPKRPPLDPTHTLEAAPRPAELPRLPADVPALIAGKDLEHYWNFTKWPALVTVGVQALVFIWNQAMVYEWSAVALLAVYLAVRVRRIGGDAQYLLAVTGIGGAFTGFGTALVHLAFGGALFYLAEFIRLPFETAIVAMALGTLPPVALDRWRARRARRTDTSPPSQPNPNHGSTDEQ